MLPPSTRRSSNCFFAVRRRHTRFKCDWSSDVCSSDLRDHFTLFRICFTYGGFTVCVCVAACVYECVCMNMCVCMRACVYECVCVLVFVCGVCLVCVVVGACVYECVCMNMCVCMRVCVYECVCVLVCVCGRAAMLA